MCIPIIKYVNDEEPKRNARKVSKLRTEKQIRTVVKYPPKIVIRPKEDSPRVYKCKHGPEYLCQRKDCSSKHPPMVIIHNKPDGDSKWGYSKSEKKGGDDGWGSSKSQKNDGWGSGSKAGGGNNGWGSGSNANANDGWGSSSNKAKSNAGDKGWGFGSNKARSTTGDNGWGSSSNKAKNDGWGSSSNNGNSGNDGWGSSSNKAKSTSGDNGWGNSSNKAKSNDGWGSSSNKAAGNDGWGSSSNKAKSNAGGNAWGGASAIPVSNKAASNDGWGSASAIPANNDGWGNSGGGEASKNSQNNNNKKENKKDKKQKNNQNNNNNNNKQKNKNKNKNNQKNNNNDNDGWGSSDKKKDTGNDGWGSSSNKAASNDGWGGGASAIGGNGSNKAASNDGWGGGASAIPGSNKAASNGGWGATSGDKDRNDGWGSNSKKGSKAGSIGGWGTPEPIVVASANVPPPILAFDITGHSTGCGSSCSGTSFRDDCSTCIAAASAKPTDFVQDIRGNWYQAFSGPLDKTAGDFIRGHDGRTYKKTTTSEREIMTGKRAHVHDSSSSSTIKRTNTYPRHSSSYNNSRPKRRSDSIPLDRDNFTVVQESYDEDGNLHIWRQARVSASAKRRPTSLRGPRDPPRASTPQAIYPPSTATKSASGLSSNLRLSGLSYINAVLGGGNDPTNIGPILRNASYQQRAAKKGSKRVPVSYVDQYRID